MNGKRLTGDHVLRRVDLLDLKEEAVLVRLLVLEVDDEGEVGHQGLIVTLQVGGRFHEVGARLEIPLDAGIAPLASVVVRGDQAGGSGDER